MKRFDPFADSLHPDIRNDLSEELWISDFEQSLAR